MTSHPDQTDLESAPRVLILGKYYHPWPGGIEHVTQVHAEHLATRCRVEVLVNAGRGEAAGEDHVGGVRVRRMRTQAVVMSQPLALSLLWMMRPADHDEVHLHAPNPYAATVLWLKRLATPRAKQPRLFVIHHADVQGRRFPRMVLMPLYRALARAAERVVVTSMRNFEASRDLPRDVRIAVLAPSAKLDQHPASEAEKAEAYAWRRARFGGHPLVGFVGRHARYKGLEVLIRSIAIMPDVRVVIAGDGPCRAQAEALAADLEVADRIDFLGEVSHADKVRLLLAVDVLAFPSTDNTEAFGVIQLEAMLLGAPVVATRLPTGVADVAIDGLTALTCAPGDPDDLAARLRQVLDDPLLAERLRRCARAHVLERFSEAVMLTKLDQLLGRTPARRTAA
ncbi:glycosyltransferase [Brevundimonas sp. PAMC22021]|uniref:glycosyltransferase n=1 Tax=Brevundimonas sp. PAMC22021 TaxID=2861285 RepID=UPI001C635C1F|nr:glycosyltransferase [Brevundimonas sp. PAMC22021]QYF87651.1 glycosyltransferase [Brevundimonas sp. PAMC22021]